MTLDTTGRPVGVRRATPADLPAVLGLLTEMGLPLDGVDAAFATGLVAEQDGRVVGTAAIEPYGEVGLLRSVAVGEPVRGSGLGRRLVTESERLAGALGVRDLYLLTETAIAWFPRLGYEPVARDAAPPPIAGSVEFTVACVDTGVLMRRRIGG